MSGLRGQSSTPPVLPVPLPTPTAGSTAPDFSLSVTPPPLSLQRGDKVMLTAIVGSLGGFGSAVTLSVQGTLPAGVMVSFLPATVTPIAPKPTWPATISSDLTIDTGTVVTATARVKPKPLPVAWAAVPFAFSLGLLGWRRRGARPLVALAVLAMLPLAGGCGLGILPPQNAGGAYVIHVLATAATGQQHVVPLLVRVSD